jgi:hypothetical protein
MAYTGTRNVTVDLRISVDVSGDVSVLGVQPTLPSTNIIVVSAASNTTALKAASLFADASNGIIEYWENAAGTGRDEVEAMVTADASAEFNAIWATRRAAVKTDLQALLCTPANANALDASAAAPFSSYKDAAAYYSYNSVGELMVGYAAEALFGHPAATAAIDNDQDIADYGNQQGAGKLDLAEKLVAALAALSKADAAKIAMEVLGQDAARADIAKDNNSGTPEKHAALPFLSGDVVYVGVKFTGFKSSIGSQAYGAGVTSSSATQQLTTTAMNARFTEKQYYLKITLA